uniref:PAX-interacting protein 1 n=1 Tax=Cynoglossus semilaevis TaxID=244447 RepID=A0A3P8WZZ6_CYNSE
MTQEDEAVSLELFKDVKFYVVGDIDPKVVQLLKAGKGKEVSYNALATHIIAEDGDNPEVGESMEVFDLPVVKPSWVILSVRCGVLLPVAGFSPESGQIFFGVTVCLPSLPDDLNTLWAYVTFYGGECQLNLNKKVTHLVVKEPKGAKFERALQHPVIHIVTPDWITDSVQEKRRMDEALYHPRLIYVEPEEEEASEAESFDQRSDGSYSPSEESKRRSERMFDDSDDDSSTEKEGTNLNWTPAEAVMPPLPILTGTARQQGVPPGKDPGSSTDSGLINLCASVPLVPGSAQAFPLESRSAAAVISQSKHEGQYTKAMEKQSNQSYLQTPNSNKPLQPIQSKVAGQPHTTEQQQYLLQQTNQVAQQPQHPTMHLQHQMMQLQHNHQQQQNQQQQQQVAQQQGFPQLPQQRHTFVPQQQMHQQIFSQQQQQQQQHAFTQQQLRPQQLLRPGFQQLQQEQVLQQQLQQFQKQQRLQMFQKRQNQQQLQQQQQQQQQHLQQQHTFIHHHMQPQPHQQQQQQQAMVTQQAQPQHLLHVSQLFGHDPEQESEYEEESRSSESSQMLIFIWDANYLFIHIPVPHDGFLVGCVFVIADYPEQIADKQLLATWKRVIQACGGAVDPTFTSRCTHLLCESQVSNMFVQALRERKRCVTAHWLNTVLKRRSMVPPYRTLHLPFAFPPGAKPCSQHIISVTGFLDTDRDDLKLMAYLAGARYTGYLCRSNTVLICKEPSGLKYGKAKEWKIPCVNAQWLCDILLGNFEALSQIQHSRYSTYTQSEPLGPNPKLVQNLLDAWRSPIKVSPEALAVSWLIHLSVISVFICFHRNSNIVFKLEETFTPSKLLSAETVPHVIFTGFEPANVQQYTKMLFSLGGEVVDSSHKVTHLVATKVTRTVKFLTSMSVAKHIVSPEWLEESFRSQKFVDEQPYILKDAEAEVLFGFSLEESLKRAQCAPLFKGKFFFLTPGICPSLSTMKSILESAGGKLLAKQPSFRKIMEHKQDKNLPEIILISCDNDLHLCREYFLRNIDVHNAEFILTGILTQKLDYDSYPLEPMVGDDGILIRTLLFILVNLIMSPS